VDGQLIVRDPRVSIQKGLYVKVCLQSLFVLSAVEI